MSKRPPCGGRTRPAAASRELEEACLAPSQPAEKTAAKVTVSNRQSGRHFEENQLSKLNAPIPFALIDEPSPLMPVDLEPFVELPGQQSLERASDALRLGYRCKQTGVAFATVDIPISTVAQFVALQASVRMTIDGEVVAETEMPNDHGAFGCSSERVSLVQLIEKTLHVDNLRMEEAGPRELNSLLQQLEISVQRVKAALAAMHIHGITVSTSKSG